MRQKHIPRHYPKHGLKLDGQLPNKRKRARKPLLKWQDSTRRVVQIQHNHIIITAPQRHHMIIPNDGLTHRRGAL